MVRKCSVGPHSMKFFIRGLCLFPIPICLPKSEQFIGVISGLLNPLDSHHHLRADDVSIPFREGVVLEKPTKPGRGPLCDVGLDKVGFFALATIPSATFFVVLVTGPLNCYKIYEGQWHNRLSTF